MADGGNVVPSLTKAEHIGPADTGDNIEAKRAANYVWDGAAWVRQTSASGGDGVIFDGVSSAIKATVLDYVNSNPLAVRLSDTAGDYVGAGAGTQYTEDAVAAADPVGTAVNLIRKDTPATITTTDGDNVAQRGTNYGAGYVQVVTSAGAFVDTFGGGTQYADGAVRGTATGTVAMGDDGTNIQSIKTDAAGELQVDVLTLSAVTGTVTANIGTVGTLATAAKQDTMIANLQTINALTPSIYDYISLSYTGDNLTGVVFKTGGSSGTTVSTLTLAYTGSVLTSVTKT